PICSTRSTDGVGGTAGFLRADRSRQRPLDHERRLNLAERMIEANGVELCTESFGDATDPPILLVMGSGGSMLWWEEAFCLMVAGIGRVGVRYDPRRPGRPGTDGP